MLSLCLRTSLNAQSSVPCAPICPWTKVYREIILLVLDVISWYRGTWLICLKRYGSKYKLYVNYIYLIFFIHKHIQIPKLLSLSFLFFLFVPLMWDWWWQRWWDWWWQRWWLLVMKRMVVRTKQRTYSFPPLSKRKMRYDQ